MMDQTLFEKNDLASVSLKKIPLAKKNMGFL